MVATILPCSSSPVRERDPLEPLSADGTGEAVAVEGRQGQALIEEHFCPGILRRALASMHAEHDVGLSHALLNPVSDLDFLAGLLERLHELVGQSGAEELVGLRRSIKECAVEAPLHVSHRIDAALGAEADEPAPDAGQRHTAEDVAGNRAFLLAARGERLEVLYTLALDSAMRQGELFGLHWPQVDFNGGTVFVTQALEETKVGFRLKAPKSKASKRRIALAPETAAALNDHRRRMLAEGRDVKTGPVFVDTEGGFLRKNNLHQNSFARMLRKAGVPRIGFHGLRHTSATLLLLHGINIKAVSVRLGHSSIKITLDTYAHFLPEMDTQTVGVVQKLLFDGVSSGLVPDCPTEVPQAAP